jgi:hypothetical protein
VPSHQRGGGPSRVKLALKEISPSRSVCAGMPLNRDDVTEV